MWLNELYRRWVSWPATGRRFRRRSERRPGLRLSLEQLEDRMVLSNFTAATVSDLIADINAANQQGGANTIMLAAGKTFQLAAVDNTTDGATGLPVIAAKDNLTILGNGDTIARSTASGTPHLRLFDVAAGAALTLENLTLQNGLADGGWGGGAIYNRGTLKLTGVTVQGNSATAGGALYVAGGTVSLAGDNLSANTAVGIAANGYGGALYVASGTVSLSNDTLSGNTARGGVGRLAGIVNGIPIWYRYQGYGGGIYVSGGTVTSTNDILSSNAAVGGQGGAGTAGFNGQNGGNGGPGGIGYGGGVCVAAGKVTLSNDTLTGNLAQGGQGGQGGKAYPRYYPYHIVWGNGGNGGNGGDGFGGGLCALGGSITLTGDTITSNTAQGGNGGAGGSGRSYGLTGGTGVGEGGGLFLDPPAVAYLDPFTVANVVNNTASTSYPNIYGSYTIRP